LFYFIGQLIDCKATSEMM